MQLIIKGRNIEVNDRLKEYVEKKLGKMISYLPDVQEIRVELAEEKSRKSSEREVVQVTMRSNGTLLRAEERNATSTLPSTRWPTSCTDRSIATRASVVARWSAPRRPSRSRGVRVRRHRHRAGGRTGRRFL